MEWQTQSVVSLHGLDVEVSVPVLVKRSRWYCWFPSLIRQPNGVLIYDRVGYGWNPIPDDDPHETKSVWVMRLQINP